MAKLNPNDPATVAYRLGQSYGRLLKAMDRFPEVVFEKEGLDNVEAHLRATNSLKREVDRVLADLWELYSETH